MAGRDVLRRSAHQLEIPGAQTQARKPEGSIISIAEYSADTGWELKTYEIMKYYPHVVLCKNKNGMLRSFTHWEFLERQKRCIDRFKGGRAHKTKLEIMGE